MLGSDSLGPGWNRIQPHECPPTSAAPPSASRSIPSPPKWSRRCAMQACDRCCSRGRRSLHGCTETMLHGRTETPICWWRPSRTDRRRRSCGSSGFAPWRIPGRGNLRPGCVASTRQPSTSTPRWWVQLRRRRRSGRSWPRTPRRCASAESTSRCSASGQERCRLPFTRLSTGGGATARGPRAGAANRRRAGLVRGRRSGAAGGRPGGVRDRAPSPSRGCAARTAPDASGGEPARGRATGTIRRPLLDRARAPAERAAARSRSSVPQGACSVTALHAQLVAHADEPLAGGSSQGTTWPLAGVSVATDLAATPGAAGNHRRASRRRVSLEVRTLSDRPAAR